MKNILIFLLISCSVRAFSQDIKTSIMRVMMQQQIAWNNGDIDAFMESYWNNDSLAFIGKKGITTGWKQTRDQYKKSYPDKTTMGELRFEILQIKTLSSHAAYVTGKWNLKRDPDKGDIGGYFTLLFRKLNKRWVIVSDHTS